MSIANNCMVANLQIGVWEGRRLDRDAGKKIVAEAEATDSDAVRVNKLLIPKECFSGIVSARNKLRQHFLDRTLPWKNNGDRILLRKMYMRFIQEWEELHSGFDAEVRDFVDTKYPAAREVAEFRMGKLFSVSDYPDSRELSGKFYARLDIDAVSEAGDFRVNLDQEQVDLIREDMEARMKERIGAAMADVYQRVHDTVEHFMEKTGDEKAIFRDSMVLNLRELADVLPGLNLLNDPNLRKIGQDIKNTLYRFEPKDLRKNPSLREEAAREAAKIVEEMRGFMNAFAPGSGQ